MKLSLVFREVVYMSKYFLIFLILLGICGCGSDEDTSEPIDEDPIEKLVGTWNLINYDDMNIEDTEEVRSRLVISSDSTLLWKMWLTFSERLESSPLIYMKTEVNATIKGSCVVSDSSLAFIYSEDALNLELHYSFEAPGNPELQQRLEQELEKYEQEIEEREAEVEENFVSGLKVESYTGTLNLEGNILTLIGDDEKWVFEKR